MQNTCIIFVGLSLKRCQMYKYVYNADNPKFQAGSKAFVESLHVQCKGNSLKQTFTKHSNNTFKLKISLPSTVSQSGITIFVSSSDCFLDLHLILSVFVKLNKNTTIVSQNNAV